MRDRLRSIGFLQPIFKALDVAGQRAEKGYGSVPNAVRMFVLAALLIGIPFYENPFSGGELFDERWLAMFRLVGLYIMLGLGLNIVVGYAGLLDLGYVAFFAVGAYFYALLASPASPAINFPIDDYSWIFWVVLPLSLILGALVGILLGIPVLPLRGDYLAIVTLGFGEIIRLFLINQTEWTGGSQGLYGVKAPPLLGVDLQSTALTEWYIFIVLGVFFVAFCAIRLRDSRVGRAWEAIREDEDVAEAMGIDTVKYKLFAFAMGASMGAFGGVIFAAFQGSAIPDSFDLLVSINVLAIVVIGGMGNTWGVVLGAVILIGIPDFLRFREAQDIINWFNPLLPWDTSNWAEELRDNRFIAFGLLLVIVMILRPAGLIPSQRRKIEFETAAEEA